MRRLLDSFNRQVEFGDERLSRLGVPRLLPLSCGTGLRDCLGMNLPSRAALRWCPSKRSSTIWRSGETIDDFVAGFPTVKREQVVAFLEETTARMIAKAS